MLKKLLQISILIFYRLYLLLCLHSDKTVTVSILNFLNYYVLLFNPYPANVENMVSF